MSTTANCTLGTTVCNQDASLCCPSTCASTQSCDYDLFTNVKTCVNNVVCVTPAQLTDGDWFGIAVACVFGVIFICTCIISCAQAAQENERREQEAARQEGRTIAAAAARQANEIILSIGEPIAYATEVKTMANV